MQPIETRYDGCHFRSRTEARWAVFFNTIGLRYEYEREGYILESGAYLPDFWLPEIGWWFEVKGQHPTAKEINLCAQLSWRTGNPSMLCIGMPVTKPQIMAFPSPKVELEAGLAMVEPIYHWAQDRRNAGEYWLVSKDGIAFSVGPAFGPDCGKYPVWDSGLIAKAYEAARSARFERR